MKITLGSVVFVFLLGILFPLTGLSEPYFGDEFTYYQPDGSSFQIRLYGDEYYAVAETLSGQVVIRDPQTGYFCYAGLTKDGSDYISTGEIIGVQSALPSGSAARGVSLPPAGLRITKSAEAQKHAEGRARLNADSKGRTITQPEAGPEILSDEGIVPAPPGSVTVGDRVGLVLLIEFPDQPQDVTISQAEVDAYCNEPGYTGFGNTSSVRDYFYNQSDGKLNYNCLVTAYYTAQNNRDYYTDNAVSYGTRARELIREALDHLKATGFDFTRVDGNGDGTIDGVNTFYAGTRVNEWSEGLWPHKSSLTWSGASGTGVSTYMQYQITDMTTSLKLGTFCHENGHMLCGFPDLYIYSSTKDPQGRGVGYFSLMCRYGYSTAPIGVDAYLKYKAGWSDVTTITSASRLRGVVNVDRNHLYRYANPSDAKEYFLIETRQKTGDETSTYLRDQGLAIWHVDEDGSNTYPDGTHYELSLEQADGLASLEAGTSDGGAGDLFHNGDNDTFTDTTLPNAHWWDGSDSSLTVHSISAVSDPMTFIFGEGALTNAPEIGLDNAALEPVCSYGVDADSQTFTLWNAASGTVSYTVSDNAAWLSLSPASGTVTAESDLITVTYNTDALASGTHAAIITVTDPGASNSPQTIPVSLTVFDRPGISLSTNVLSQLIFGGADASQDSFVINNAGSGTLSYSVTSTQSWVSISPSSGSAAMEYDTIYVDYSTAALLDGVYYDTLTITDPAATNSPQTISISITITGMPGIVISPTNLFLTTDAGTTGTVSMVISNTGGSGLTFSISAESGPENYTVLDSDDAGGPIYSWIDITGTGTEVTLPDDGESSLINIGFGFPFYDTDYTQFQIGANGVISFSAGQVGVSIAQLPSTGIPSRSLAPFWDDLNPESAGSVYYYSQPDRLVVSFEGVPRWNTSEYQTFQAVLYSDGRIVYQYNDLNGTLTACSVGLQNDSITGSVVQVAYSENYLKNDLAIEFMQPEPPWLSWDPDAGTAPQDTTTSVWFTANASALSVGVYTSSVLVAHNDPKFSDIIVPVVLTVLVPDEDSDGLPDWWETQYFGGATNAESTATCSNGVNSILEAYVAGLDPTDPDALFEMIRLGSDAGDTDRYVLQWNLVSNRLYTIYWASNLFSEFSLLQSNVTADAFTDTVHSINNDGFYRIEVDLVP